MMKIKSLFRRGHHTPTASKQSENSTLKGATSISSLDSKHHKVAPTKEKSSKVFGSKDKLHKSKKKEEVARLSPSNEGLDEEEKVQLPNEMEVPHFEEPRIPSLKRSKNNNKIEFSSADELSYTGKEKLNNELYKNNLSSSCRLEKTNESLGSSDDLLGHQEFASLPPMPMDISTIEDIPINEAPEVLIVFNKILCFSRKCLLNFNYIHYFRKYQSWMFLKSTLMN